MSLTNISLFVTICTLDRAQMLKNCLDSLTALVVPSGFSLNVVVIENDSEPRSRNIVDSVASESAINILYEQEPQRGIPFARNRALEVSLKHGADWIAFIDDDETVRTDWLANFSKTLRTFDGDVFTGPVNETFETPAPHWRVHLRPNYRPSGSVIQTASTNNTFMTAKLADADGYGLRFDTRLNVGEDVDYFRRAREKGAKIVWISELVIEEFIPASRVKFTRWASRELNASISASHSWVLRRGLYSSLKRYIPKILVRFASGVGMLILGVFSFFLRPKNNNFLFRDGILKTLQATGFILGLLRMRQFYYDKIDGK